MIGATVQSMRSRRKDFSSMFHLNVSCRFSPNPRRQRSSSSSVVLRIGVWIAAITLVVTVVAIIHAW